MKKIITTITFVCVLLFATLLAGCQPSDKDTFTKPIDTTDLALEYTVYEGSFISVKVTPLVDIKDLKVDVTYYQSNHILHQHSEWIEEDFLAKGNSYHLSYDISETYPLDRVGLYNISGHKKENCIDFTEEKRVGIIKAPTEKLSTELFTIRFDNSYDYGNSSDNDRFFGRLYITSSIDLWDVKLSLDYDFENSKYSGSHYQPDFEKIVANGEIYVDIYKPIDREKDIKLKTIKIESATGSTSEPIVVNG